MKSTYYDIVDLRYEEASLTVRVVELVDGEPDGYIGIPLVVAAHWHGPGKVDTKNVVD